MPISRNFSNWDKYLNSLIPDIYMQESGNDEHTLLARQSIYRELTFLYRQNNWQNPIHSVLDIGCGSGFCKKFFDIWQIEYTGIAIGEDVQVAQSLGYNVQEMDMNFLDYPDDSFDLLFSRHSLEHGVAPLLSLMEWHRVSSHYLHLILPNPSHYGYVGKNHYAVMPRPQIRWLLRRAGWRVIDKEYTDTEFRFLCEKLPIIGSEGWAEVPLDTAVYELDRDD